MGSRDSGGPEKKVELSWPQYVELAVDLADALRKRRRVIDPEKDRLIVPQIGAALVGMIVGRRLGFTATEVLGAGITSYSTGSTEAGKIKTGQLPTYDQIHDKRVTIVDDCCDGGSTLKWLEDYCLAFGPEDVVTGVVYHKPNRCRADFRPDVYVRETDDWIEFPDGHHERVGQAYRLAGEAEAAALAPAA